MRNKKGFTLIELLAVIVILAVIALIATPIIMNVINDAKKGAAKDSAYAIIGAAELEMSKAGFKTPVTYNEKSDLNYKGTKPSKMNLEIDVKGKSKLNAFIDGYCVVKDYSEEEVTIDDSKKTADTCINEIVGDIVVDVKDGMIPVTYDSNGNTIKADTSSEWYNYDNKMWANAVVVTSTSRDKYKSANPNTAINEADILGYYVYIPRYRYQLWNAENGSSEEQEIKIEFERKSTKKSNGTKNGEWLTHPAFTFGSSELNGIWVGKFEMTGTKENPTTKPNEKSLTNINNKAMFDSIKGMQSSTYGLSNYDSHMMKNIEWGAAAYLTQSKYGRCTNGTCSEVWMNNVNTGYGTEPAVSGQPQFGPTITGCSGVSVSADTKNNMTSCEEGRDYKQAGVNASTTGNIYGIYDMAGGTQDNVMGVLTDENGNPIYSSIYESSGFNADNMPDSKYYDKYELTTGDYDFSKGKLGDATKEILKVLSDDDMLKSGGYGWYNDFSYMPVNSSPWVHRGGFAHGSAVDSGLFGFSLKTGIFAFHRCYGSADIVSSSRAVVVAD